VSLARDGLLHVHASRFDESSTRRAPLRGEHGPTPPPDVEEPLVLNDVLAEVLDMVVELLVVTLVVGCAAGPVLGVGGASRAHDPSDGLRADDQPPSG
jgi:hypothetical protein